MDHQRDVQDANLGQGGVHVADVAVRDAVEGATGRAHRFDADLRGEEVEALLIVGPDGRRQTPWRTHPFMAPRADEPSYSSPGHSS